MTTGHIWFETTAITALADGRDRSAPINRTYVPIGEFVLQGASPLWGSVILPEDDPKLVYARVAQAMNHPLWYIPPPELGGMYIAFYVDYFGGRNGTHIVINLRASENLAPTTVNNYYPQPDTNAIAEQVRIAIHRQQEGPRRPRGGAE